VTGAIAHALVVLLAGCGDDEVSLVVDVRTDFAPAVEFHAIALRVVGRGGAVHDAAPIAIEPVFREDDYLGGQRVTEVDLAPGSYEVLASLLDQRERSVAERFIVLELRSALGVTAEISRRCLGVDCESEDLACRGGLCTDPRCTPETPEFCTSECTEGADCPALAPCSLARCQDGLCLYGGRDELCGPDERCAVEVGCVRRPEAVDAGPSCDAGFVCDGTCVDSETDPLHCGGCDRACPAPTSGGAATCTDGRCDIACDVGLVRCGGECAASCETTFASAGTSTFTVAPGCTRLFVSAWGAGGGIGACGGTPSPAGGGYVQTVLDVTPGETLAIVVGGAGGDGAAGVGGAGGTPGGGGRGGATSCGGGGGGGFSGVFRGDVLQSNALAIAGGGGGSGVQPAAAAGAGAGGGATGQDGPVPASGATQSAGGMGQVVSGRVGEPGGIFVGGNGGTGGDDGGGGGGGGYYGGGASPNASTNAGGGGGGSGYVTGDLAVLVPGNRALPGNPDDARRGTSGAPRNDGLVIVECVE
jgi:hypothetical protein